MLFIEGKKHAGVLLIFLKSILARLVSVGERDAHKTEEQGVRKRAAEQIPPRGHEADRGKSDAPPHEDLAEIIRVPRVFPKPRPYEPARFLFAENVHLHICRALQENGEKGEDKEHNAARIELWRIDRRKDGGQDAPVYDEGRHEVDPDQIDEKVPFPRLFFEHRIPPVLMSEPVKGIRPICREPYAPDADGDQGEEESERDSLPDPKRRKDDDGLDAPIGVVDGGVPVKETEQEHKDGRRNVGDEEGQPKGERERQIDCDPSRRRRRIDEEECGVAVETIVFQRFHR